MFHQVLNKSVYMAVKFVLFLCFVSGLLQPEYWCSQAISVEKSYNKSVSSVKEVILLPNFMILWRTG